MRSTPAVNGFMQFFFNTALIGFTSLMYVCMYVYMHVCMYTSRHNDENPNSRGPSLVESILSSKCHQRAVRLYMYVCIYVYVYCLQCMYGGMHTDLLVRTAMVDIIPRMAYQVPISSADRGSGLYNTRWHHNMKLVLKTICMYVSMNQTFAWCGRAAMHLHGDLQTETQRLYAHFSNW